MHQCFSNFYLRSWSASLGALLIVLGSQVQAQSQSLSELLASTPDRANAILYVDSKSVRSFVVGTGADQQRHKAPQLAGRRRWLQPKSGSIDGTDGVLGRAVVWAVSDSRLSGDGAFQFANLLQNPVQQFSKHG